MEHRNIFKWPEDYIKNTVPWYVILKRGFCLPFVIFGVAIAYVFLYIGYGRNEATFFKMTCIERL